MAKKKRRPQPFFAGVDPGKTGGIAAVYGPFVSYWPMPPTEMDQWALIEAVCSQPRMVYIEWINPGFFKISKSSAAKLFGNYMAMRMALTAAGYPWEDIKPTAWQQGLGIAKKAKKESQGDWKDRLRAKAQQLFPKLDLWDGPKGIQLAVCDAILIAEFCRRKNK